MRDAFHAPLLFVYGADDPAQARANEEVARAWAQIRWGTTVKYPSSATREFFARGEALANDHALFLVGNAKSNRVVRALEPELRSDRRRHRRPRARSESPGSQVGAAFVRPNPRRPDRYLVVVEGVDALGTWRSLSLPDLIPDFVVWDEQVGAIARPSPSARGCCARQASSRTTGQLPAQIDDPLAARPRAGAKSEYEATPPSVILDRRCAL